mmetsp:Transcript_21902/g.60986  ORF Transcript_21902/g.60986 Transcript_21902/m.60986 type:complete len:225 (-) Transcript_21902:421-1095(-)
MDGHVMDLGFHCLAERHEACSLFPLQTGSGLVGGVQQRLLEALHSRYGDTHDERMVTLVHVGVQQRRCFRIRPCHDDQRSTHDIGRETCRDQSIDVFLCADEHFASHMAALFGARLLIFEMHTRGAGLYEHLREFHDGAQSTMASVAVGNNWSQILDLGSGALIAKQLATALLVLTSIMEELGADQLIHLVWDRVGWIIRKVRPWFVGGRCRRGTLPSTDVNGG